MPLLEDWFNLVAICLGAICLDEPAKMHMAKTVGHHRFVLVGEAPILGTRRGEPLASRMGKSRRAPDRQ